MPGETWQSLVDRVSGIGEARARSQYRELIGCKYFIPGGQILRGADCADSVLYNCFVTGAQQTEYAEDVAARISQWTRQGAGVGINLDALGQRARESGSSVCKVITEIARSQHQLWLDGITRTATMVTLSLNDPEIKAAAMLMTAAEHFRHLNLGVLVSDRDMVAYPEKLASLSAVAWRTGNPGFIFIDRVRRDHPFPEIIRSCNPCGEQFLADEEGCNLGSLNLAAFVFNNQIDWAAFRQASVLAIRFLDNIVDASSFPSAATADMAKRRRRLGLGVMGFATALQKLGVPYGSSESINIAETWGAALRKSARMASRELANEKGAFSDSPDGIMRNSHLLSIAPTGAISMLCNTSSGIEPVFGEQVRKGSFEIDSRSGLSKQNPGPRALRGDEVPVLGHVGVLAAWQCSVDGGISKTVNMSVETKPDEIQNVVLEAWRRGCKGVSIFRDGSRSPAITRTDTVDEFNQSSGASRRAVNALKSNATLITTSEGALG